MTANGFRLDRYLARIGLDGPLEPGLETLAAIHAAHVHAIPFEGIDPLLGRPVRLDLETVQAKLVDSRRGGYCFEHNALLQAALETIGFRVTGLGGRVRWMSPPDSPLGPRTHMLLKVELDDGPYLADVGFGVCLLDAPLRFATDIEQPTALGTYRLTETDGLFALSAQQPAGWRVKYVFNLEPQIQSDYELGSWFASTSPLAPFTSRLIVERLAGGKRHKLADRRLTVEGREGRVEAERMIDSAEELGRVLDQVFGIAPPVPAATIFERIGG
jgi:N-hydroxyarylamine O-acetyltransferase